MVTIDSEQNSKYLLTSNCHSSECSSVFLVLEIVTGNYVLKKEKYKKGFAIFYYSNDISFCL